MTAAEVGGPGASGRPPFADATPAQIRAALTSEDVETFDAHWRSVMERATASQDLTEVFEALESWRQVAWLTSARGPEGYRRLLATAAETVRTGEPPAGTVTWSRLKAELGLTD